MQGKRMEIWEVRVSAEWYPGQLRAGAWEDLGSCAGGAPEQVACPQELWAGPPSTRREGVRSPWPVPQPCPGTMGEGKQGKASHNLPPARASPPKAPQPPSASWGGQGLFLPCSPSPQLGCSWCRGVRMLSLFLLPPLSSLPRRHALPSLMEGCLQRGCALLSSGQPFLHEATHTTHQSGLIC